MKPHLKYLWYVVRHKWFVLVAGLKVGEIPLWRLIIHDYSKFSKAEWGPYVRRFFSGNTEVDPDEFKKAFEHHWRRNPHHWEYWVTPFGAIDMQDVFIREMVADWLAAGRGITGSWDLTEWYAKTKDKQNLAPNTRRKVENLFKDLGYNV